jgi:endoglucanase Acf2
MSFMSRYHHSLMQVFGDVEFNKTGYVFGWFVICRAMHFLVTSYRFKMGQNLFLQMFFTDVYDSEDNSRFFAIFRFIIHFACYGLACYFYYQNDKLKDESMVARLWFMVEMVSGLLEWPFIAWQLYIVL